MHRIVFIVQITMLYRIILGNPCEVTVNVQNCLDIMTNLPVIIAILMRV